MTALLEQEGSKFSPALVIKPHHVIKGPVRDALLRKDKINVLVDGFVSFMNILRKRNDSDGTRDYFTDVLGISRKGRQKFRQSARGFLRRLQELPDEVFVHIDLRPDGICNSCIFGIHCRSTNYQGTTFPLDSVSSESASINRIHTKLTDRGYEEGTDFIFYPTVHTLYDFQGRTLAEPLQAVAREIRFNSLVVRMGALRNVVRDFPEYAG